MLTIFVSFLLFQCVALNVIRNFMCGKMLWNYGFSLTISLGFQISICLMSFLCGQFVQVTMLQSFLCDYTWFLALWELSRWESHCLECKLLPKPPIFTSLNLESLWFNISGEQVSYILQELVVL